jgi:DNA-binding response OmpR family regulator
LRKELRLAGIWVGFRRGYSEVQMVLDSELNNRKVILVADDDVGVRSLVTSALSDVDEWCVTTAKDGKAALKRLDAVQVDLVILDIHMPELDGLSVYNWLRQRSDMKEVPVLFMSATTPSRTTSLGGTYRWLAKPFDLDDLMSEVADLLH